MIRTICRWYVPEKNSIHCIGGLMAAGLLLLGATSCGRSKKNNNAGKDVPPAPAEGQTQQPATRPAETKIAEKKEPATPPLPASTLQTIGRMGALVLAKDQPCRPGILIDGTRSDSSGHNYLVICETPPDMESVGIACQGGGKLVKAFAKRISTLPSGLSLFGFSSVSSLTCAQVREPMPRESFHAIRLTAGGSISAEEEAAVKAELDSITVQMNDLQKSYSESMRQLSQPSQPGQNPRTGGQPPRARYGSMRDHVNSYQEKTRELGKRKSELNAQLKIPASSMTPEVVASGTSIPENPANELDNTLLGTSSGNLTSIRFKGKWISLKEIIEASADQVNQVKLDLSGSNNHLNLTCHLSPMFPSSASSWSMVAVTTYELESQGSGSLEERLARATRIPFNGSGKDLFASLQPQWNGRPTKLWLKIFNNKETEKPIIDEVVLLNYPGRFSARWGKPPSPLIQLPDTEPNTPPDLVKEQVKLDAKGQIRDMIAAGDGSVVMVQTNQPPYWAALDMKSGKWLDSRWKATADTLAATQAGKIYLIDRKTRVVEIWNLASGKREGMQLLQLDGPLTAAAAPLTDEKQPILVTTGNNGYFLDPVKFEVLPSGLNLGRYFDADSAKRYGQSPLNPATICLRASDDGSLYQFSASSDDANRSMPTYLTCTVDRSGMVVDKKENRQFLPSRGRNSGSGIPDHGGSATMLTPSRSNDRFPGTAGEIRFMETNGQQHFAILKNPPVLPEGIEQLNIKRAGDCPLVDRTAYLDLSVGVLLLPDADTLHLIRLDLPAREKKSPDFLFAGEVLKLPLPVGTGHKIISDQGGTTEITPDAICWTAPEPTNGNREFNLKMEWTGELGSPISKDYRVKVIQPSLRPEAVSPDGLRKIPLRRRTFMTGTNSNIDGFAGSGTVALNRESGGFSAWNLITGEMILNVKTDIRHLLGDADLIHVLDQNGRLSSYDMQTGNLQSQTELGKKIAGITTGMSSRDSLLAVEHEGAEAYLIQVPRDGMKPHVLDLSAEARRNLFVPELKSNVSGSFIWSRQTAIYRDSRAITIKPFPFEVLGGLNDGVPDVSGQFLVGQRSILGIGSSTPKSVEVSSLPGATNQTTCKLEKSGRYILLSESTSRNQNDMISVRDVREPSKELLKIHQSRTNGSNPPVVISATNTLIQPEYVDGNQRFAIYEFDIPELIKQLSR